MQKPPFPPSKKKKRKRKKGRTVPSFTMILSCTPCVLEYSSSNLACFSRSCTLLSSSVPRPRRRSSSMSSEGGAMKTKRAEMSLFLICFTPFFGLSLGRLVMGLKEAVRNRKTYLHFYV